MSADERQVGGNHYKDENGGEEHWTRVYRLGLDYFQACITKYVERCWKKNGLQDLEKARHFLDKYIELHTPEKPTWALGPKEEAKFSELSRAVSSTIRDLSNLASAQHPHPHVREYGAEVAPTGWIGFVFEGANAEGFLFTCQNCAAEVYAPPHDNPHKYHRCP